MSEQIQETKIKEAEEVTALTENEKVEAKPIEKFKLISIERANINPDKKNEEGLRNLLSAISDELPIEEIYKIVKRYGYGK